MPNPDFVIIRIMCRCYFHCSGTESHVYDYGIRDYGDTASGDERVFDEFAMEVLGNEGLEGRKLEEYGYLVSFIIWMNGYRSIA